MYFYYKKSFMFLLFYVGMTQAAVDESQLEELQHETIWSVLTGLKSEIHESVNALMRKYGVTGIEYGNEFVDPVFTQLQKILTDKSKLKSSANYKICDCCRSLIYNRIIMSSNKDVQNNPFLYDVQNHKIVCQLLSKGWDYELSDYKLRNQSLLDNVSSQIKKTSQAAEKLVQIQKQAAEIMQKEMFKKSIYVWLQLFSAIFKEYAPQEYAAFLQNKKSCVWDQNIKDAFKLFELTAPELLTDIFVIRALSVLHMYHVLKNNLEVDPTSILPLQAAKEAYRAKKRELCELEIQNRLMREDETRREKNNEERIAYQKVLNDAIISYQKVKDMEIKNIEFKELIESHNKFVEACAFLVKLPMYTAKYKQECNKTEQKYIQKKEAIFNRIFFYIRWINAKFERQTEAKWQSDISSITKRDLIFAQLLQEKNARTIEPQFISNIHSENENKRYELLEQHRLIAAQENQEFEKLHKVAKKELFSVKMIQEKNQRYALCKRVLPAILEKYCMRFYSMTASEHLNMLAKYSEWLRKLQQGPEKIASPFIEEKMIYPTLESVDSCVGLEFIDGPWRERPLINGVHHRRGRLLSRDKRPREEASTTTLLAHRRPLPSLRTRPQSTKGQLQITEVDDYWPW